MKNKRVVFTLISLLFACVVGVNVSGCVAYKAIKATDLTAGITPQSVTVSEEQSLESSKVIDFAVRLFKASEKSGENTLVSPMSVLYALAMTANGAKGRTLAQMEQAFGMSVADLNLYLYGYKQSLAQGKNYKASIVNSVWFKDDERLTVNRSFLQTNADYYGAGAYKAPFDEQTLSDINNWVNRNTNGLISKILDKIPEQAIMYLVNTLAFEAEWRDYYRGSQVKKGEFTKEDGTKQNAEFMYETESWYFADENAVGFKKDYWSGYSFAAILPNEGISVSEYVASLTGNSLIEILNTTKSAITYTSLPKFKTEYGVEMSDILKNMGITDAFDYTSADFSGIGTYSEAALYISRVLHKNSISVDEKGTKAASVTVVEEAAGSAAPPEETKYIYLNRPFVYMIIDNKNSVPLFIGTMTDINA